MSAGLASTAVTCYWGGLTASRFLQGAIADRVGVYRRLDFSLGAKVVAGLTFVLAPWTSLAVAGLTLLGVSLAPTFPALMTQTPDRVGRLTDHAVGLQSGATMVGVVSMPGLGGILLERFGIGWLNGLIGVLAVVLGLTLGSLVWSARKSKVRAE